MSELQDRVRDDLKRFMSDEPQDNIDDIRKAVKGRLVVTDSVKIVPLTHKDEQKKLYSDDVNRKISRARLRHGTHLVNLAFIGIVFGGLAAISMVIVNYPYNLVLVSIVLTPPVVTGIRILRRYGYTSNNKRELL